MVSTTADKSPLGQVLGRWGVRVGWIVIGLVILVVVLNLIPTIHDPTEGVFSTTVVNGLGTTIELRMCDDDNCRSTVDTRTLRDGVSFAQNAAPSVEIPFRVLAVDGTPLACWVLPASDHAPEGSIRITEVVPCPK
ncbi:MAG: hypothetical protein ABI862_21085 [Ilumatobacteraceae bacterium]